MTIDAMGTQSTIAHAIRQRDTDYVLAIKDNQPTLAEALHDFFELFKAALDKTPHKSMETVQKNHNRWKQGAALLSISWLVCTNQSSGSI